MIKLLFKTFLAICFLLLTQAAYSNSNGSGLLDYRLKNLFNQRSVSLTKYQGLPIAMVFFEEGCGWCLKLMMDLEAIQGQCPNMVQPIAVGIDTGSIHGLKKLARKAAISFPVFLASDSLLAGIGGVEATPYTLFADKRGGYKGRLRGYVSKSKLLDIMGQRFELERVKVANCQKLFG